MNTIGLEKWKTKKYISGYPVCTDHVCPTGGDSAGGNTS